MSVREKYADIIDMTHHVSSTHPRMSRINRAAQFSPFAALTGYEEAVAEAERRTNSRIEISEDQWESINAVLRGIQDNLNAGNNVSVGITYFIPDDRKAGGAYVTLRGEVKKVSLFEKMLILTTGEIVPFQEIYSVEIL